MKQSMDEAGRAVEGSETDELGRDDATIGQLFDGAGPRPSVPEEDLRAIKSAFRQAWREEVATPPTVRGWSQRNRFLALAASLLAALSLVTWWLGGPPIREAMLEASFERIDGQALVVAGGSERALASADAPILRELPVGTEISTEVGQRLERAQARSRVAFRIGSGPSIRLDHGSRVRVIAADVLRLDRGAIYVDSAAASAEATIEIRTVAGVVRDIGTQFEVRLLDGGPRDKVQVRVREGMVEIEQEEARHRLEAEQQLTIGDGTDIVLERIDRHDPEWAWIQTIAPGFAIDGQSLGAFLTWAAREMGVSLEVVDEAARTALAGELGGTVAHLAPAEAVAAVLMGAGLEHELAGGVLTVRSDAVRTSR